MTGNTFNFVDLSLNLNQEGKFSSAVCIKPTDQGLYTNFNSNTPLAYKKSVVKTLIHRALKYSSDWDAYRNEINRIKQVLADNNYPQRMIEETVNKSLQKHFSNDVTIRSDPVEFYVQVFSTYSFNKDRNLFNKDRNILKEHLKPVDTNKQIQLNAYFRPCKLGSQFSTRIRMAPIQTSHMVYQFQCPIDG